MLWLGSTGKLGAGLRLRDKLPPRVAPRPALIPWSPGPSLAAPLLWLQLLPSAFLPNLRCQVHVPTFTIFCFCSTTFNSSLLPSGWRLHSFLSQLSPSRIWPRIHFSNLSTHCSSQLQSDASRKVRRWKERRRREGGRTGKKGERNEGKRKEEETSIKYQNIPGLQDFPGGPMAETLRSQCKGLGFHSWSGNEIPHAAMNTEDPACHN